MNEVIHAPYYALFLVGPVALAWELYFKPWQTQSLKQETDSQTRPAQDRTEAEIGV